LVTTNAAAMTASGTRLATTPIEATLLQSLPLDVTSVTGTGSIEADD
jgi:hypothetical protein